MNVLLMYEPTEGHFRRLQEAAPGARLNVATSEASARAWVEETEVVLGNRWFLQTLPSARRLRWMQSNSMGVDLILRQAGPRLRSVTLTCVRGIYEDELAEHALALLLGVTRGLRAALEDYQRRQWGRWSLTTLAGRRSLVLGWGTIGRAVGIRLRALGMHVQGVRRSVEGPPVRDADQFVIHGPETWRQELATTDVLLVTLPWTSATEGCVGRSELQSLPASAIVVNVGRGAVMDESALFELLHAGRLAGAGLDTVVDEPPAADADVWNVPRLLLTPHVGRSLETGSPRWEPVFEENLRRFWQGLPLLHVVDQQAGY
jgi:phosphoglycerate dehydrogenase-like enzyme